MYFSALSDSTLHCTAPVCSSVREVIVTGVICSCRCAVITQRDRHSNTALNWLHSIALNCTALSISELNFTVLHWKSLHWTELYCTDHHCTKLHCIALKITALNCKVMHWASLHSTALYHCNELHFTALNITALNCTILTEPPWLYCTDHSGTETPLHRNALY